MATQPMNRSLCVEKLCSVRGCGNTGFNEKMHKFPSNRDRCQQWLDVLMGDYDDKGRPMPLSRMKFRYICGLHFAPGDYTEKGYLKRNALPTVMLGCDLKSKGKQLKEQINEDSKGKENTETNEDEDTQQIMEEPTDEIEHVISERRIKQSDIEISSDAGVDHEVIIDDDNASLGDYDDTPQDDDYNDDNPDDDAYKEIGNRNMAEYIEDFSRHINESEPVKEKVAVEPCPLCLSTDRTMTTLNTDELLGYTLVTTGFSVEERLLDLPEVRGCWECRARLADVVLLRKQVKLASIQLAEDAKENLCPQTAIKSLSRLKAFIRLGFDQEMEYTPAPLMLEVVPLAKKKVPRWNVITDHVYTPPKQDKIKSVVNVLKIPVSEEALKKMREEASQKQEFRDAPYKCETCIKIFKTAQSLETHIKMKHSPERGQFSCDICRIRYKSMVMMSVHRRKHRSVHECAACGWAHYSLAEVTAHYGRQHLPSVPVPCNLCSKTFTNVTSLKYHKETVHRPAVKCKVCKKKLSSERRLKRHMTRHTARPHPCPQCGKLSASRAALWLHQHNTHGERAQCELCGRLFRNRRLMLLHRRNAKIHRSDEDYKHECDKCGSRFLSQPMLRKHTTSRHGTYKCDICEKIMSSYHSLYQHKRYVHEHLQHPKERLRPCAYCGKEFAGNLKLKDHIHTHTGERPYVCARCGKSFSAGSNWSTHKKHCPL